MYGEGRAGAERRLEQEVHNTFGDAVLNRAPERVSRRSESRHQPGVVPPSLLEARTAKLEALDFDMINSRKATISKALNSTCTWILTHQTYLQWKEIDASKQHFGFFWIKGIPGAGKSVLVRYLDLHTSRFKELRDICISFYFHARGNQLEKSLEGMYRSLLTQLLRSDANLQFVLDDFRSGEDSPNMLQKLRLLLSAAVAKLEDQRLFCFIDALDECDEANMQETIEFLRGLCEEASEIGIRIFVCFASRHYPALDIPTELQLILETVDDHHADLREYVTSQRFSVGTQGRMSRFPVQITNDILAKANGVFLWVVLVVEILKKEFKEGNIHTVKAVLKGLPERLEELFQKIVQRDQENIAEFLLCLTWILHAKRPLTLKEFCFAMTEDFDHDCHDLDSGMLEGVMHNFLCSRSKGLAELTRGANPRVQFIHESVREFLLKHNGFAYVDPNYSPSICHANEKLKQCCIRGIRPPPKTCLHVMNLDDQADDFDHETYEWCPSKRQVERKLLQDRYPFMEYAVQHLLIHADQAAPEIPQWEFIGEFDLNDWRTKANWLQRHDVNVYSQDTTLAYVFAQSDCANLMSMLRQYAVDLYAPTENRNRFSLFAAFANKSMNAARVLLDNRGVEHSQEIIIDVMVNNYEGLAAYDVKSNVAALIWACERGYADFSNWFIRGDEPPEQTRKAFRKSIRAAIRAGNTTFLDRILPMLERHDDITMTLKSVLHEEASCGHVESVKLLLEWGVDINASNKEGTVLYGALRRKSFAVAKLLLERGADVNIQERNGEHALTVATAEGSIEIIQLLLTKGADVNAQGGKYGNVLQAASCQQGNDAIVQLLLEHGADVNAQGGRFGNALQAASSIGSIELVKLLLEHGADVNAQGGRFGNALQAASSIESIELVKLLLEHGANVNAQGGYFGNALQATSYGGPIELVKLLLEHGADVNAQGGFFGNALQAASYEGSTELVKLLLEHGADVNAQRGSYGSALKAAVERSRTDVEELLRRAGAVEN
jgi:ankyrin repeat protein